MATQTVIDNKQAQNNQTDNQSDNQSIITRVANFKPEPVAQPKTDDISFNPQDFDKITSVEEAKAYADKAYKSFEKGFQKKFQDLAELKKTLESKVGESSSWTTEKVQSLLQDPSFVSAAQGVLGQSAKPADDDYSALSEAEKQRIAAIERQNQLLIQQQTLLLQRQQDETLKSKYPRYKQDAVDTITAELLQGKIKNTREYIWKAYDYEEAVNNAYQLGRQDERKNLSENIEGASYQGGEATPSTSIKKEKGETNESLLRRLYSNALKSTRGAPK